MAYQIVKIPGASLQMPNWSPAPSRPQAAPPPNYHIAEAVEALGKVIKHFSPEEKEKRAFEKEQMEFDRQKMAQQKEMMPAENQYRRDTMEMNRTKLGMQKSAFESKAKEASDFESSFNPTELSQSPQSKTIGGQRVVKQYAKPNLPPNPFNRPDVNVELPLASSEIISGNKMEPLAPEADTPPEWLYSPDTIKSLYGYNSTMRR